MTSAAYEKWREQAQAFQPDPPRDLTKEGFTTHEAQIHLDLPYLAKGLFDRGQIVVLWGSPGSGKTFTALSMAAHIGAGKTWLGRRIKKGKVLYVCAESTRKRLENRVSALKQTFPEIAEAEVLFLPITMDLLHGAEDIKDVIRTAKEMGDIAAIFVDTLAVTFGGGNENAPEDMGQYVANMKMIRTETGAAVVIVHHCGKDEAKGMRGHSALLGALDAELVVEKVEAPIGSPNRILKAGKLREGDSGADLCAFSLDVVTLGIDPDGDHVTTCVMRPSEFNQIVRRPKPGKQAQLLAILEQQYQQGNRIWTDAEIRELAKALMHRNGVTACVLSLVEAGYLKPSIGGMTLGYPPAQ